MVRRNAATQKIYGLGYNLLVVVYVKEDVASEQAAYLDIRHVIYVDQSRTGDFNLTKQIRAIVKSMGADPGGREAVVEDLDAPLQDKNTAAAGTIAPEVVDLRAK